MSSSVQEGVTDAEQRRLQRLAVTGDPGAATAWVRLRVRAGELTGEQVQLAAYLGDDTAARALEEPPRRPAELRGWVRGLKRYSKEACVRAAVAAAELVLTDAGPRTFPGRALQAARNWLDCPCRSCADEAETALHPVPYDLTRRERAALEAARAAAGVLCPPVEPQYRTVYSTSRRARTAARLAASCTDDEQVRTAITQALLPWALGHEPETQEQRTGLTRPRPTQARFTAAWTRRCQLQAQARAQTTEPVPVPDVPAQDWLETLEPVVAIALAYGALVIYAYQTLCH